MDFIDFADEGSLQMKRLVIGILAHVDAGKTTLSEGLLYISGRTRKLGRVDKKDAYLDNYELERARGITIFSKQAVFGDRRCANHIAGYSRHVDFSTEMERTLQVLDYAILVISGADGIQDIRNPLASAGHISDTCLCVHQQNGSGWYRQG